MSDIEIISATKLAEKLGISRCTVWRWVRDGILPKPIHIGPQTRGWRAVDIEQWLRALSGDAS